MVHYVILCDWAVDHLSEQGVDISGVAHSLEEAKEILAQASVDEKKYAQERGYTIYTDTDVEFDAGEEGHYFEEHSHFYIEEVK